MNITCPSCNYSKEVAVQPAAATVVTCPRCTHRFSLKSAPPPPPRRTLLCPRCGVLNEDADSCISCGVVFAKYRPPEDTPWEKTVEAPTRFGDYPVHSYDTSIVRDNLWILTDRRIGRTVWLIVAVLFVAWLAASSIRHHAIQKKVNEINEIERQKAEAGPSKGKDPDRIGQSGDAENFTAK